MGLIDADSSWFFTARKQFDIFWSSTSLMGG